MLFLANNELSGSIPKGFEQLVDLEIFQLQNNKFSSFLNLELLKESQSLVLDYDKEDSHFLFENFEIDAPGMADTIFDD